MGDGRLIGLTLGAALVFFLVFGSLHDISQADETDYTLEYLVLVFSVPAFGWIYWKAFQILMPKGKAVWLAATGAVILLCDLSAVATLRHPKYANDPTVASSFLAATLPVLGLVCYRLIRVRYGR